MKEIFDIYLNNICHIVFPLNLVRKSLGEDWLYAVLSNKISQNFTNFQIHEDGVAIEKELCSWNKELNMSECLLVYAVLQKHY